VALLLYSTLTCAKTSWCPIVGRAMMLFAFGVFGHRLLLVEDGWRLRKDSSGSVHRLHAKFQLRRSLYSNVGWSPYCRCVLIVLS
jgi:hypothetical protein